MFTYLLFDLDGTLTDPVEGITKSIKFALESFGINELNQGNLERFIGPPLRDSFRDFYGMSDEEAEIATAKYRDRYIPIGIYENEIYPGIRELLISLKSAGKILAVASSKPLKFVEVVLRHFDILKYFDVLMGSEMDGSRGTKEEVVDETLRLLKINELNQAELKHIACMIGDRKYDISGGKKFGLSTIGVTYGYGSLSELKDAGADYLIDSTSQLGELILREINP